MGYSLFSGDGVTLAPSAVVLPSVSVETLFAQLDNHLRGYESVQTVYAHVACESLTFVDTKNVVLFNEYMRVLGENLGVPAKSVDITCLESQHLASVNCELSLEGWLKDMWTKIKGFFSKIFNSIKEFMKKYFTRLGRLKNKLSNIKTVAGESGKGMGAARLENLPSGLASKFKGFGDITETEVSKVVKTARDAMNEIKTISNTTRTVASNGVVSREFISEIKRLKEVALAATKQISDNKAQKSELGVFKDRKERKEINNENKTLAQTAKDAQAKSDVMDDTIVGAGVTDGGGSDESQQAAGQEAFKEYLKSVTTILEKYVNVKMVGGKTITKVSVNNDNELEVEFDESDGDNEPAKAASLTNSEGVSKLAGDALDMIKDAESQSDTYVKTNDEIMKLLSTIDGLVADIDRNEPERYGKYRQVLDKQIRTRLNMMKVLFRSYNQVSRNFFEVGMNTGDAVVDYCVVCMKNFK